MKVSESIGNVLVIMSIFKDHSDIADPMAIMGHKKSSIGNTELPDKRQRRARRNQRKHAEPPALAPYFPQY